MKITTAAVRLHRGSTLALVLVVATLAFLAAFVLAGTTSAHLGFTNQVSRGLRARLLAEAAVTQAIATLKGDPSFGQSGESLVVELPGNPRGALGRLSFDSGAETVSTFNLLSDGSRPGYRGRIVPAHSVHLVGEGSCLGAVRRVEAVLTLPPYPYAIASSGSIESEGELLIGSLDPDNPAEFITAEDLHPAHLASNNSDAMSVILAAETTVVGDIRSVGGLVLRPGVVVKGQALEYGEPVALPQIPLASFDPQGTQVSYQNLPNDLADTTIVGTARAQGDVVVFGDLNLKQSKVYIDGHLTVRGQITGSGVVVARGGATIYTGARLSGGQAVLLSGGDVLIEGGGPLGSFFEGFVYVEGEFRASDITVVGSFVSRGEGAGVKLRNARVLGDPNATSWQPASSHAFHFAVSSSPNEPALLVSSPGPETFAVSVRLKEVDGDLVIEVDNPLDGAVQSYDTVHVAARQIAVLANDVARQLRSEKGATSDARNLVARAETLESSLERYRTDLNDSETLGFDLNRFLSQADRLRVTLWREL